MPEPNALELLHQDVQRLSKAVRELQGSTPIRPEVLCLLLQRCAGTPYISITTIKRLVEATAELEDWMVTKEEQ